MDKDSLQLDVTTSATNTCTTRLVEFLCVDNSTESDKEHKTLEINKEYLNSNDLDWYDSFREKEADNLIDTQCTN